jgi:sugar lactone lactonase YvrE
MESLMHAAHIRCLAATGDVCGEGCVWHPQQNAVFWTDINRRLLHRYPLVTGAIETWRFDQPVTAVVLTTQEHLLALVLGGRIVLWDTRSCQETDTLFRLPDWPAMRCNDARVDPAGVLWFGTMQNNVQPDGSTAPVTMSQGSLYSLAPGDEAKQWRGSFGIMNTLAWSPTGETMYFGDTLANCIYRGRFDPVSSRLESYEIFFADFERGLPDGSAMDIEGHLWNCRFGGASIVRIAPDGSIAGIVETTVRNPTTCAFATADASTLLYTSAVCPGQSEDSLFSLEAGVRGLLATPLRL